MIVVIMGVSGAGKSLIGKKLAQELGWPFFDADDYHPAGNIGKMRQGIPLSDQDRLPWLRELARIVEDLARRERSAVIALSALRSSHREMVAGRSGKVHFVWLKGEYELIQERLRRRHGHFMHPGLLRSQFDMLEEPGDAVIVESGEDAERSVRRIRQVLGV